MFAERKNSVSVCVSDIAFRFSVRELKLMMLSYEQRSKIEHVLRLGLIILKLNNKENLNKNNYILL
jgi:hypothetical protein